MKKLTTLFVAFALVGIAHAGNSPIEKTIKKYSKTEGCEVVHVSGILSGLASMFAGAELKEEGIEKLSGLDVLTIEDKNLMEEALQEVMKAVKKSDMKEMMRVFEDGEEVYMYFSGPRKKADEFLIVTREIDELSVVYIQGVFNLETITQN